MKPSQGQRFVDNLIQLAKAFQRKFYYTAYARVAADRESLRSPQAAPFRKQEIHSIVIFKPDEIGDVVYSLPSIKAVKETYPAARIILIAQGKTLPLVERTSLCDRIYPLKVKTRFFRFYSTNIKNVVKQIRKEQKEISLAIFLRPYPTFFKDFLKIPARYRLMPEDPRMKTETTATTLRVPLSLHGAVRKHASLQLLELVEPLTRVPAEFSNVKFPDLKWTEDDEKAVKKILGRDFDSPILILHPFVKFETKFYPYWSELVRKVIEKVSWKIVIIGGPEDGKFETDLAILQAQGKLSIAETACLISRAKGFLGVWSGPAHIAGAMGIPTVTLASGVSSISEWKPLGRSLLLSVDVPCAPCHRFTCPTERDLMCLKALTPERVAPEVTDFLLRHANGAERLAIGRELLREFSSETPAG